MGQAATRGASRKKLVSSRPNSGSPGASGSAAMVSTDRRSRDMAVSIRPARASQPAERASLNCVSRDDQNASRFHTKGVRPAPEGAGGLEAGMRRRRERAPDATAPPNKYLLAGEDPIPAGGFAVAPTV